jgi:hypothetical protein
MKLSMQEQQKRKAIVRPISTISWLPLRCPLRESPDEASLLEELGTALWRSSDIVAVLKKDGGCAE